MSTEIKNTLFRFVTMRAPEFVEKSEIKKFHVVFPQALVETNIFIKTSENEIVNPLPIGEEIEKGGTKFAPINKREDIRKLIGNPQLYDFSIWLIKNRKTLKQTEIIEYITDKAVNEISNIELVWNNLFHQITLSQSNYVRDGLLAVLIGNNFIANYQTIEQTDTAFKKLAHAKVILPKDILTITSNATAIATKNQILNSLPNNTNHLQNDLNVVVGKQHIESLKTIVEELTDYHNKFQKKASSEYLANKKAYDDDLEIQLSNATVTNQTYIDKEIGINRTYTDVDFKITDAFKPQLLNELDFVEIGSSTSVLTTEIAQSIAIGNSANTVNDVTQILENQIEQSTTTIFNTTIAQQNQTNYINGVAVNVQTPVLDNSVLFYADNFGNSPITNSSILLNTNINTHQVVKATYGIQVNNATVVNFTEVEGYIDYENINNKLSVKLNPTGITLALNNIIVVNGVLTISNGDIITFSATGVVKNTRMRPYLFTLSIAAPGTFTISTIDNQVGLEPTIKIKPSEYGISRLGIADYRKVEQEVCCYVPGEVSHIENVMASEYKERATRSLKKSEETQTDTVEKEVEKLTDTSTTDRFEMNQEIASVLAKDTQMSNTNSFSTSFGAGSASLQMGLNFAHNTSKEESNSQAVNFAKEVTERALDRVVTKTKSERISKITQEYEENNKHGFNNVGNPNHVSGVYRWIDKVYENKIVNYGKRLMYEFMIPEPAKFHTIASDANVKAFTATKPIDPRTFTNENLRLDSYSDVNESTYSHWATLYNAKIDPKPAQTITVSESVSVAKNENADFTFAKDFKIAIPEGYKTISTVLSLGSSSRYGNHLQGGHRIAIAGYTHVHGASGLNNNTLPLPLDGFQNEVAGSYQSVGIHSGGGSVIVNCVLTNEAFKAWQIKTFNAIIEAYEKKLTQYNEELKEYNNSLTVRNRINPQFNRSIENTVLRKHCIEYLISHNALGSATLTSGIGVKDYTNLHDTQINKTYSDIVKFFEQAFEWNIMSYYFYPFYWANKDNWASLYNVDSGVDPLFKSFLQSGMARVIVTVNPGFEQAVNWYLATGEIWNGGEVPVLDDPLFVSIVEELQVPEGVVEETWKSRVPTSLTIIQAGALGLEVNQALPCDDDCKDYRQFDSDGNVVLGLDGKPVSTNPFKLTNQTLQGATPAGTPIIPMPIQPGINPVPVEL